MIVTVDDDCGYDPTTVETLVRHMPADRGAVGGLCQEPRGTSGTGEWRRIDQVGVGTGTGTGTCFITDAIHNSILLASTLPARPVLCDR